MPVMTIREAVSQALWEEMERDHNVIIMGEEVGVWGGTYAVTKGFYDHFGLGDVVEITNSGGHPLPVWDTYGDWTLAWPQWQAGSAVQ